MFSVKKQWYCSDLKKLCIKYDTFAITGLVFVEKWFQKKVVQML